MDANELTQWIYPAFFVVAMLIGAMNAKALALVITFTLGLTVFYPDVEKANFLFTFFLAAVVLASFRD